MKIIRVIKRNPKSPQIQSNTINNVIFVIKNGFHYKETRNTLIMSIALVIILLIIYLYFLATGGYENNIFVRFFQNLLRSKIFLYYKLRINEFDY